MVVDVAARERRLSDRGRAIDEQQHTAKLVVHHYAPRPWHNCHRDETRVPLVRSHF
jgi:hypothetical protein